MNFIALFIFCLTNLVMCKNQILARIEDNSIWVKYKSISESHKIDSLISFMDENNINKIFLEVYSNGEILPFKEVYNIANNSFDLIEEKTGNKIQCPPGEKMINGVCSYDIFLLISPEDSLSMKPDNFNPISYLFERIKTTINHTKIYAYLDIYKLWDKNYYPENITNHFYYECPECLEADINGKSDRLIKLDEIQSLEWQGIFLSPLHPKVNEYLLSIFKDITTLFSFDGILLDNLRYQNYYYGYNSVGVNIFEHKYKINPFDINRGIISRRFGYTKEEADSISTLWDEYRIVQINELLYKLNDMLIVDSIDVEIGAFVNINIEEAKNRWYQDWYSWIDNELVDFIIVDNSNNNLYDFNYNNKLLKDLKNQHLEKIAIGLDLNETDPLLIGNKILSLRLDEINKISLYYYDQDKKNKFFYNPIYKAINFNLIDAK